MPSILFIVGRAEAALYQHVKSAFADVDSILVIHDRREGDRRREAVEVSVDRRRRERRIRDVSRALLGPGWAIVRLEPSAPGVGARAT